MSENWATIAAAAVGLLTVFVTKAGEKIAENTGQQIYDLIKKKFKGDKEAEGVLSGFLRKPKIYQEPLADILREKAEADYSFGRTLKAYIPKPDKDDKGRITQFGEGTIVSQAAGEGASSTVTLQGSYEDLKSRRKMQEA